MRLFLVLLAAAAFCFADDAPGAVSAAESELSVDSIPAAGAATEAVSTAEAELSVDSIPVADDAPGTVSSAEAELLVDSIPAAAEPDSIAIYEELIARENAQSHYQSSQLGIVVGSGMTIGGVIWFHSVWTRHRALKREIAAREDIKASSFGEALDDMAFGIGAAAQTLADYMEGVLSFTVGLAGVAIFGTCVSAYKSRKEHAAKRDEYRDSLERLRRREKEKGQSAVQVLLVPTVDVANAGGGASVMVMF